MNSDHPRMLVLRRTAWICTFLVLCIVAFMSSSACASNCRPDRGQVR
jgi:hypothetical protein